MNAHGPVQWRAITADDGAEWARLVLAVEQFYGTEEIVGADDLVEDLRDPNVDAERGTIAAFSEGSMIAYAGLRASPGLTGRHKMHLYGGVHPGWHGRGLGTRLLAWAEQAAPPLHQARYPGHPLALSASCPAGQSDALALFAAAGYTQARWFHFMSRELSAVVAFTEATGRRESYIATIGVRRPARSRGIASALIRRSLAAAQADGCTAATLHVDADSPTGALTLYEHLGFSTQYTSVTLIKDLTDQ